MKSLQYGKDIAQEIENVLSLVDDSEAEKLVSLILDSGKVFLSGTGRSGLAARAFAMRLGHLGITSAVVGDVTAPCLSSGDLLIVCSGSGETKGQLVMVEKAKKLGGKIALLTINPCSSIGSLADATIHITAPTPKVPVNGVNSIQPLASLFEQCLLLVLDAIVMKLMDKLKKNSDEMFALHANLE